jgi:small subunit ribosomal protein S2
MKQLLEAGVHFGHQTRRWNPKMRRFLFGERNGIYIIDLRQTVDGIERSYAFVRDTVARGGTVLFVGTKKQAQETIQQEAERCAMPYVNQRWLGGMLTNFETIRKRLNRLRELDAMDRTGAMDLLPKKEVLQLHKEKEKLEKNLGGIRDMTERPRAIWVVDTKKEQIAVGEARKLGIPVVAILDSNCDPDEVDLPIPGNDDAIRSVALLTHLVADAVEEGKGRRGAAAQQPQAEEEELVMDEPLADWELQLLAEEEEERRRKEIEEEERKRGLGR